MTKREIFLRQISDSSRVVVESAGNFLLDNPEYLETALELAFENKPKFSARASRALYFASEKDPEIVPNIEGKIVDELPDLENQSAASSLIRIFASVRLPDDEDLQGLVADYCFRLLLEPVEKAALRVYALEILYGISNSIPELKRELVLYIKRLLPYSPMSFKSRGGRIIRKIEKEIGEVEFDFD